MTMGTTTATQSIANFSSVSYTNEQNINLIVVGTRGRSGIKKMLLGSVASELVIYAACPILVVKWEANIGIGCIYRPL